MPRLEIGFGIAWTHGRAEFGSPRLRFGNNRLATSESSLRVEREHFEHGRKQAGPHQVIGRTEIDVISARVFESVVQCKNCAAVLLQTEDKQSRNFLRQAFEDFGAVVRRTVIDNNDFISGRRLPGDRADGLADDGTMIEIWNYCRKAR